MTDPADLEYWENVDDPRAAVWSDDNWQEGIDLCLEQIEPYLPDSGMVLDVGAGINRLAVPIVEHHDRLIVHTYEPSATMRLAAARHHRIVEHAMWPDGPFQGAYIVAVLQHLSYFQQADLIAATADRLTYGGVLIFQTVLGTADGPGSHHTNLIQVREWCHKAHLNLVGFTTGKVHENWLWTVAVRA
jgi:hypothetical protein